MIVFTLLMLLASTIGDSTGGVLGGLLPFLAIISYYFFSELFMDGQTLGKKALNIKVVRIDGKQPSVSDYLLRAIFQIIDTVFSFGVLSALMISTSHKRQRLGDMTANTTVIRTRTNTEFRLSDILRINSLDNYQPTYPEVKKLSDDDMLLIKSILRRQSLHPNDAHSFAVSELIKKITGILGIQRPQPGQELIFLKTLLKDYIVLTR